MKFNKDILIEICKIIKTIEKVTCDGFKPSLEVDGHMDKIKITIFTNSHCYFPSKEIRKISSKAYNEILDDLIKWHKWLKMEYGYRQ